MPAVEEGALSLLDRRLRRHYPGMHPDRIELDDKV